MAKQDFERVIFLKRVFFMEEGHMRGFINFCDLIGDHCVMKGQITLRHFG